MAPRAYLAKIEYNLLPTTWNKLIDWCCMAIGQSATKGKGDPALVTEDSQLDTLYCTITVKWQSMNSNMQQPTTGMSYLINDTQSNAYIWSTTRHRMGWNCKPGATPSPVFAYDHVNAYTTTKPDPTFTLVWNNIQVCPKHNWTYFKTWQQAVDDVFQVAESIV